MKTLGRILIILLAFAIIMGITYAVVNAGSSSATAPAFERGEGFPQADGAQLQFPNGERPEFPGGERTEFGGGWMFGLVRNIGIVAMIVALIAVPKSLLRRKSATVRIN